MHDEKIEERLRKLEKRNKSAGRFFTQYILAPILVVAIGFVFNIYLNQTKDEIEHMLIPALFYSLFPQSFLQKMS